MYFNLYGIHYTNFPFSRVSISDTDVNLLKKNKGRITLRFHDYHHRWMSGFGGVGLGSIPVLSNAQVPKITKENVLLVLTPLMVEHSTLLG